LLVDDDRVAHLVENGLAKGCNGEQHDIHRSDNSQHEQIQDKEFWCADVGTWNS